MASAIQHALPGRQIEIVTPECKSAHGVLDFDLAFVSRDVTGLSTKHQLLPYTQLFYEAMRQAPSLQWVHVHSAGADRQIFVDLMAKGVQVTTSSGTNAGVVVQTALAGLLSLSRRLPQLMAAQRAHTWAPLIHTGLPPDLAGQTAVIVGWGAIGQQLAAVLTLLGLSVIAVRRTAAVSAPAVQTVAYSDLHSVLPRTDWLVLACPLTAQTRRLIESQALAALPKGAHLINVARGEVVDEAALVHALQTGHVAGAYLDVFEHEPLATTSPLWDMPQVIATPHSAGFSDGNAKRVEQLFLDNVRRWSQGEALFPLAT
jgi:phosphoglycerate dehydrogenase-like enzyme